MGHLWSPENPDSLSKAKSQCPAAVPNTRVNLGYRHFGNKAVPTVFSARRLPESLELCKPPASKQAFLARVWEVVSCFL